MKVGERAEFVEKFLLEYCLGVMDAKRREYTIGDEDANVNFKRVGARCGLDAITTSWVYGLKHVDSISNWVQTRETPSGEPIQERIGDAVNYLLILASLIEEEEPATLEGEGWRK